MNDSNIYISLPQSTLVFSKKVHLEDIATILCIDKDIENNINKIELFSFPSQSKQQVISINLLFLKVKTPPIPSLYPRLIKEQTLLTLDTQKLLYTTRKKKFQKSLLIQKHYSLC